MEAWIAFGRGPLFRLSFVLMLLGLGRVFVTAFLTGIKSVREPEVVETQRQTGVWRTAFQQLGFIGRLWWWRPLHSFVATLFHVGFIAVPLFVASHIVQWHKGVGFSWWELPQAAADKLTLLVIVTAPILAAIRFLSRKEGSGFRAAQIMRPLILAIPFAAGYICVNGAIPPTAYYTSMLIHVWAGNLLMLAIPFTGIADCILQPVSSVCSAAGYYTLHRFEPLWEALIRDGGEQ
jgi:hypothetical protein